MVARHKFSIVLNSMAMRSKVLVERPGSYRTTWKSSRDQFPPQGESSDADPSFLDEKQFFWGGAPKFGVIFTDFQWDFSRKSQFFAQFGGVRCGPGFRIPLPIFAGDSPNVFSLPARLALDALCDIQSCTCVSQFLLNYVTIDSYSRPMSETRLF